MLDFLKTIFGDGILTTEYQYPSKTPMYIRTGYKATHMAWNQNHCILLDPTDPHWRLPTVKKQLQNFQSICEYPCALYLEGLTVLQRRNLVENNIPFVSSSQQVYLPFWGCSFFERFKVEKPAAEKMAPGTQLVFLYLYYSDKPKVNLTQIAEDLQLSKATCNRAINDLTASGLVEQNAEGRIKWITIAGGKAEFLRKGYPRLKSPVERLVYTKTLVDTLAHPKSGLQALAELTMIGASARDGAIAISKKASADILASDQFSQREFEDFGGYMIEVWSYDPCLLACNGRVDDISLLLSLENNRNERIQMGLDTLREKHGLPIQDEE